MSFFVRFDTRPETDNLRPASAKPAIVAKPARKTHKYAPSQGGADLARAAKPAKAISDEPKGLAGCASDAKTCSTDKALKGNNNIGGLAELATLAEGHGKKQIFIGPDDEKTAKIKSWRSLIGKLPVPDHQTGLHIGTIALHFLSSPHVIKAVTLGWNELELFGLFDSLHPTAPLRRHDAMGLVPSLALSRLGARLVALEVDRAILKARSGSRLVYPKRMIGRSTSIPLWKHPLLGGDKVCRPG